MKKVIILIFLGIGFCLHAQQYRTAWDTIPSSTDKKIINYILDECFDNQIDPELIFALISVECDWKLNAKPSLNSNGTYDYGPMRLNGPFIDEYASKYGKKGKKYNAKTNIYDNLELGIRYFASLYNRDCNGNALLALYSYNCGYARTMRGQVPKTTKSYALSILSVYDPSYCFVD